MFRVCILLSVVLIMILLAFRENYGYVKKIYSELVSPAGATPWHVDIVDERLMSDAEEDELESMERMAMFFMLCVSSILVCWNFNHYRRKDEKEEYESKLNSIEKRFLQRLEVIEEKFIALKREFQYSCENIEMIYSREDTVRRENSVPLNRDACHQIGTEFLGIERSSQTKNPSTKDGLQQTTGVTEAEGENDLPQITYWNPVASPGTGDLLVRSTDSWYDETQKEEHGLMGGQDTCNMSTVVEFVNDPCTLEMEVAQCSDAEDEVGHLAFKLDQGIVVDVCKVKSIASVLGSAEETNDEKTSPREFEDINSATNKTSNYRRIPQYQGFKKNQVNPKQQNNTTRHIMSEDSSPPFMFPKAPEKVADPGRHSRPTTPRQYTPPDGVEFNQVLPNRRRKPRNYNVK